MEYPSDERSRVEIIKSIKMLASFPEFRTFVGWLKWRMLQNAQQAATADADFHQRRFQGRFQEDRDLIKEIENAPANADAIRRAQDEKK